MTAIDVDRPDEAVSAGSGAVATAVPGVPRLGIGRPPWWHRFTRRTAWPAWSNAVAIVGVMVVTLSQLHPNLLFLNTTTAGGDTGAHVALPAFLKSNLLTHGQLTGWDPGWYDGFPLYTFYFPLPGLVTVFLNAFVSYDIAFKLVTVLGSVLLPLCAWAFGRLAGLRDPGPACLAAATLPFLFEPSFTIYGGNLLSTLAGEFSFSLSLSLSLLFLGVVAAGLRTGRHRALAAVLFAVTLLCHLIPAIFAAAGAGVWLLLDADLVRTIGRSRRAVAAGHRWGGRVLWSVVAGGARPRPDGMVAGAVRTRAAVHDQHGVHQGLRLSPSAVPGLVPLGVGGRRGGRGGHGGPTEPGRALPGGDGRAVGRRGDRRPGRQALQRPVPAPLVPVPLPVGRLRAGRGGLGRRPAGPQAPAQPVGAGRRYGAGRAGRVPDWLPGRRVTPYRRPVPGGRGRRCRGRPARGPGRRLPGRGAAVGRAGDHPGQDRRARRSGPAERLGGSGTTRATSASRTIRNSRR